MYAPVRGGTRGGAGDFKWSDVKDVNYSLLSLLKLETNIVKKTESG